MVTGAEVDEAEIEDLFDELEDLSDSGPEVDTISITSTPKPSLRPYFSSSRSLLNEGDFFHYSFSFFLLGIEIF